MKTKNKQGGVKKICRYADVAIEDFEEDTEELKANILRKASDSWYDDHPKVLRNHFVFFRNKEGEWFWKFENFGWADVYFPLNRLPKEIEKKVREVL